jgi:hypothetical protein
MFRLSCLLSLVFALNVSAARAEVDWGGFLAIQGQLTDGPPSWLEDGNGRFERGGSPSGRLDASLDAKSQLGIEWTSGGSWRAQLHALARSDLPLREGRRFGLTEAWLEYQRAVSNRSEVFIRAGSFFYPSSMENSDPLWASPYTLTHSSINSWFGEEFRPQGFDIRWRRFGDGDRIYSAAATVFYGNDTLGTLLAWRGWSLHNRLSVFAETLPLPLLPSLANDGLFAPQRRFASTAFGEDLDGRPGIAARLGVRQANQFELRLAHVDNRGDRQLHGNEYAWHSRFSMLAVRWQPRQSTELLGEWVDGDTRMNFPGNPWVDAEFKAYYLMLSQRWDDTRLSLRYDRFSVSDQLRNPALGIFDDTGEAWTLALMQPTGQHSRIAAEVLLITGERRDVDTQKVVDNGGKQFSLEWRVGF